MPEMAEVETVRNVLKKSILNKKITNVEIYYQKIVNNDSDYFINNLINSSFVDILRRGKYLIFETENFYLVSHLRMEGKYYLLRSDEPKSKHEHVKIIFNDLSSLRYVDTRKFGRMELVDKNKLNTISGLKDLGYEVGSKELTANYLYAKIHQKNLPIKSILLDQTIISGLGNIYADEVLFASSINPHELGKNISLKDCENIIASSSKIIADAIKCGGTTIRSYTSSLGVTGHYQDYLQVHKRENLECFNCKTKIVKDKIGGRSTYYCPNCQK